VPYLKQIKDEEGCGHKNLMGNEIWKILVGVTSQH